MKAHTVRSLFGVFLCWFIYDPAIASDAKTGEQIYQRCIACHSFGRNRTGPDHCGLIGRVAGTKDGFQYTDAMRSAKILWTVENLDLFLTAPLELVPGTSMGFISIREKEERSLLIRYLQTKALSDNCEN